MVAALASPFLPAAGHPIARAMAWSTNHLWATVRGLHRAVDGREFREDGCCAVHSCPPKALIGSSCTGGVQPAAGGLARARCQPLPLLPPGWGWVCVVGVGWVGWAAGEEEHTPLRLPFRGPCAPPPPPPPLPSLPAGKQTTRHLSPPALATRRSRRTTRSTATTQFTTSTAHG